MGDLCQDLNKGDMLLLVLLHLAVAFIVLFPAAKTFFIYLSSPLTTHQVLRKGLSVLSTAHFSLFVVLGFPKAVKLFKIWLRKGNYFDCGFIIINTTNIFFKKSICLIHVVRCLESYIGRKVGYR